MFHRTLQKKYQADATVNILFGDLRRGETGHRCYGDAWSRAAHAKAISRGARAYAHQQADAYYRRSSEFRETHDKMRKEGFTYSTVDHTLVCAAFDSNASLI